MSQDRHPTFQGPDEPAETTEVVRGPWPTLTDLHREHDLTRGAMGEIKESVSGIERTISERLQGLESAINGASSEICDTAKWVVKWGGGGVAVVLVVAILAFVTLGGGNQSVALGKLTVSAGTHLEQKHLTPEAP